MPKKTINNSDWIEVKKARVHNLKSVDVRIPRDKFIVVTGLSGSGKSSLAFDTLYAEGQRRYVESLSSYARQFLGRLDKPDVDSISGLPPAIAIEQKVNTRNPRSTVGTSTEIYDYLKLLYARIGDTISPASGKKVENHDVSDVVDYIMDLAPQTQIMILAPLSVHEGRDLKSQLEILAQQGFSRVEENGEVKKISEILDPGNILCDNCNYNVLIDRIVVDDDEVNRKVVSCFLEKESIRYLLAENGQVAVDLFVRNKIDIIFMDISMPIMNGFEAFTKITEINKIVPIIALTALAQLEEQEKCMKYGIKKLLKKPAKLIDIKNTIKTYS